MMGSSHQTPNQVLDELFPYLSNVNSFDESCISENGVSSMSGSSMDAFHVAGNVDVGLPFNTTNFRTFIQDNSSVITDGQPSFPGGSSYLLGNVNNSPRILTRDHLIPAQQHTFQVGQLYSIWCGQQGNQLSPPMFSPQMITPTHQVSIPPSMAVKKPRLDLPPSTSQNPMQMSSSDPMASPVPLYPQLMNQTPPIAPSPQRVIQHPPPCQTPVADMQQLDAITSLQGAACFRRLMSYMYHLRRRPVDNDIRYWRKFVEEYYCASSSSRRRWCLSKCDNVGRHAYGTVSWKCDLCRSQAGKGFEVNYEVLPRMFQIYFGSGVVDEVLHLGTPAEKRYPSGVMVLFFEKAVQESAYQQFCVLHEGQIRIAFTPELKIISWEFCIRSHDELVSRKLVTAQVNELIAHAEKCQVDGELGESDSHDLLTNCNRVLAAGENLTTSLQLPLINDLGFSKQFVRSLQISEVIGCMKDLMTSCQKSNNSSPIETLKRCRQAAKGKLKGRMEHETPMQQTPNADIIFQQPPNFMNQNQTLQFSPSCYQNFVQQRMSSDLQHNSNNKPSSYALAKSSHGPSTSRQEPTIQQKLNDILAYMHAAETNAQIARGKRRLVYDPNCGDNQIGVFTEQNGMVENGKGLNYSSSSNSSARIFADNCMVKREPESDDDSNSPNGHQRVMGTSYHH